MPGPNEPKRINPFLKPIVDDLLHVWKGISVCGNDSYFVGAALLCFSDIPTTRKVCGFPGFKAKLGYSKVFPCEGFGEPTDFSGFDRQSWVARTMKNHMESLEEIVAANTQTERQVFLTKQATLLPHFDHMLRSTKVHIMHGINYVISNDVKVWKSAKF